MASTSSSRRSTLSPNEEGEEILRPKRSSITIECSDGSKVIFVRPNRPRSGSNAAPAGSRPPSPPPGPGPGPGSPRPPPGPSPGPEDDTGPGSEHRRNRRRPYSMPAYLGAHRGDTNVGAGPSHTSLPAYLSGPCTSCGRPRGRLDSSLVHAGTGRRRGALVPVPDGILPSRSSPGPSNPRSQRSPPPPTPSPRPEQHGGNPGPSNRGPNRPQRVPSRNSHNASPQPGTGDERHTPRDGLSAHQGRSPRAPSRDHNTAPSADHHNGASPSHPDNNNSSSSSSSESSRARYSIEAVIGVRAPPPPRDSYSRPQHRQRPRHAPQRAVGAGAGTGDDTIRLELREISAQDARPPPRAHSSRSRRNGDSQGVDPRRGSPPRYFDARVRGGRDNLFFPSAFADGSGSGPDHNSGDYHDDGRRRQQQQRQRAGGPDRARAGGGAGRDERRRGSESRSAGRRRGGSGSGRRSSSRGGAFRTRDFLIRGLRRCIAVLFPAISGYRCHHGTGSRGRDACEGW